MDRTRSVAQDTQLKRPGTKDGWLSLAWGRSDRASTVAILNSPRLLGRVWGIVGGDEAFTPCNEDGRWKAGRDGCRSEDDQVPRPDTSYKDTPYSEQRINAVRERRGPRRHLSLLELIKAESAARWSSGITLSSGRIPPALNPPSFRLSVRFLPSCFHRTILRSSNGYTFVRLCVPGCSRYEGFSAVPSTICSPVDELIAVWIHTDAPCWQGSLYVRKRNGSGWSVCSEWISSQDSLCYELTSSPGIESSNVPIASSWIFCNWEVSISNWLLSLVSSFSLCILFTIALIAISLIYVIICIWIITYFVIFRCLLVLSDCSSAYIRCNHHFLVLCPFSCLQFLQPTPRLFVNRIYSSAACFKIGPFTDILLGRCKQLPTSQKINFQNETILKSHHQDRGCFITKRVTVAEQLSNVQLQQRIEDTKFCMQDCRSRWAAKYSTANLFDQVACDRCINPDQSRYSSFFRETTTKSFTREQNHKAWQL